MYSVISHQRLDSPANSIVFNGIPQTFTDLQLVLSIRSSDATNWYAMKLEFNSSSSGYTQRLLYGASGTAYSSNRSDSYSHYYHGTNATANTFGNTSYYIPNYRSSVAKSFSCDWVNENNSTTQIMGVTAGQWSGTDPVTSIQLLPEAGTFVAGSTATLYGINRTQAIGKPKAIGGNITFANGHWVHTFTGSGTFSAQEALEVDALIVAGGGASHGNGNPHNSGDGGSAGQMLQLSGVLVPSASATAVLVGSGGPGVIGAPGTAGGVSAFGTNQATGGAGGAGQSSTVPRLGGSGAGGPALTPGANRGGDGGPGLRWVDGTFYAGGGGGGFSFGGSGGIGGGGRGEDYSGGNAVAGTANTGGGGGGVSSPGSNPGKNGGSGVVIIRYRAD